MIVVLGVLSAPTGCGPADPPHETVVAPPLDPFVVRPRVRDEDHSPMASGPDPYVLALRAVARDAPGDLLRDLLEMPNVEARTSLASLLIQERPGWADFVTPLLNDDSEVEISLGCTSKRTSVGRYLVERLCHAYRYGPTARAELERVLRQHVPDAACLPPASE